MTIQDEVLAAAERRAVALAAGDERALRTLLHPDFGWTSHTGETFDRDSYVAANLSGPTRWHSQVLTDPRIVVVGDTAVLRCAVTDDVTTSAGRESFRMPMTQTWVRSGGGWQCLAGHAGPRTVSQ
ncbi:nuclear transport factor 2 family protein [Microbacterium sp. CFBP9034]|uniref:nuclear transport factor 2 family protein n=1 Tax=Microbacterium sp. CFBP9034 TaxID=3096540 RepID=UPI002A69EAC1|nr:nuclear transport factor 2 family protein [Microbacterium sp. CFBP9034]MDY0908515.1 nuclear transport factor 2 family protein [Microbacterium sp. CFBP9034]